jgi:predicted SPOUT superfamily RNA methylase MTH1
MARQQFRKGIVQDCKKEGKVNVTVVKIGGKKIAIKIPVTK